jgi:hypothetical protein
MLLMLFKESKLLFKELLSIQEEKKKPHLAN